MTSWYHECAEAFAARDYALVSRVMVEHQADGVPLECRLWLFIGAQRLAHPTAATVYEDLLTLTHGRPYQRAYVRAARGELTAQEADLYRTDPRTSCSIDYYLGAGLLTKGNMQAAQRHFEKAAGKGVRGQAEGYLAAVEAFWPAPFGLTPLENMRRLYRSAVDLHERGLRIESGRAIEEAWTQARDLPPGTEHVIILRTLAVIRASNRDFTGARQAYEELLTTPVGPDSDAAARAVLGLGRLRGAEGDYASAVHAVNTVLGSGVLPGQRAALQEESRCLGILVAGPAAADPAAEVAALNSLARMYLGHMEIACAERANVAARAIAHRYGLDCADAGFRLSGIYIHGGWYQDAIEPTEAELADLRRKLGDDHPLVARFRETLIVLYAVARDSGRVLHYATEALDAGRAGLGRMEPGADFEMRSRVSYLLGLLGLVISVSGHPKLYDPRLRATAALAIAEFKGLTLEQLSRSQGVLPGAEADHRRWSDRLQECRSHLLSQVVSAPPADPEEAKARQGRLFTLWTEVMDAERMRNRASLARPGRPLVPADLTAALPPDACLVDFVLYRSFDVDRAQQVADAGRSPRMVELFWEGGLNSLVPVFDAGLFAGHEPHSDDRYAAVVWGRGKPPVLVDIADAKTVDQLVDAAVSGVTDRVARFDGSEDFTVDHRLSRTLLYPLWKSIRDYAHVIVSPDGGLCRLPFEILHVPKGDLLMDSHLVSYVASARSIRQWDTGPVSASQPLVIGDPDFGPRAAQDRRAVRFRPLPDTRSEACKVAAALGVAPVLGVDAVKDRVVRARSPRVLHIASHAFAITDIHRLVGLDEGALPPNIAQDPQLLAGIAFTGANSTLAGTAGPEGVLFAHEVQDLHLSGTELVVLSACDTGLGTTSAGHGVYGLRRAFALAGARSQLVSLWQVPSLETAELIAEFYNRLVEGTGRAQALAEAKAAMRRKHPHPYYWAGFVLEGVPGPVVIRPTAPNCTTDF